MKKNSCFVIMPFAKTTEVHTENYWTEHYNEFLKPLIEEGGKMNAHRSAPMRGDILKEIIKDLIHSDIVVADLTDNNPNVFWELGTRQSFKHGTITIAEEGTILPFDVSSKGTLFYSSKNHLKSKKFAINFKKALKDCINNPERPDSTILETITGRGSIQEISNKEVINSRLDALMSEYVDNRKNFNKIISVMRTNQNAKKKDSISYRTERLREPCIELLITNRYLSSSNTFYNNCELYFENLNMINGQLMAWESHRNNTEQYFLKQVDSWRDDFNSFRKAFDKEKIKFTERL